MNNKKYLDMLKNKLEMHRNVHDCSIFMHDGAPCHRAKIVSEFLKNIKIGIFDWPGNSPDLNAIKILWTMLKNKRC